MDTIGFCGKRNVYPIVDEEDGVLAYLPEPHGFLIHLPGFCILVSVLDNFYPA
jgi:hypothetical protein